MSEAKLESTSRAILQPKLSRRNPVRVVFCKGAAAAASRDSATQTNLKPLSGPMGSSRNIDAKVTLATKQRTAERSRSPRVMKAVASDMQAVASHEDTTQVESIRIALPAESEDVKIGMAMNKFGHDVAPDQVLADMRMQLLEEEFDGAGVKQEPFDLIRKG